MRLRTFFRLRGTRRAFIALAFLSLVATWAAIAGLAYVYKTGLSASTVIMIIPAGPRRAAEGVVRGLIDAPYITWAFRRDPVPVYRIDIDEKDLAQLNSFPEGVDPGFLPEEAQNAQPATFRVEGKSYDAKVRYRGDTSPHFIYKKKSWRVTLKGDERFGGLKAMDFIVPHDRYYLIEELMNDRARRMGLVVPDSRFATLIVNGQSQGVYFMVEHWGPEFLERHQLSPDANFYAERAENEPIFESLTYWKKLATNPRDGVDSYAEIDLLLSLVKEPDDQKFWQQVQLLFDVDNLLKWNVQATLAGSDHQDWAHNIRLHFDPGSGKFRFIPWDVGVLPPGAHGGLFENYSPFISRLLQIPEFVEAKNALLWSYVSDPKNLEADLAYYDQTYQNVRGAFYRDRVKEYSNRTFDSEVAALRSEVVGNINYIRDELSRSEVKAEVRLNSLSAAPPSGVPIVLDLFSANPSTIKFTGLEMESADLAGSGRWLILADDGDGRRSAGDRLVAAATADGKGRLVAIGIDERLRPDLVPTNPDPRSYTPFTLTPRRHRYLVVSDRGLVPLVRTLVVNVGATNATSGGQARVATRFVDEALFSNLDEATATLAEFLGNQPQFRVVGPRTVELPAGVHVLNRDVIIPSGVMLTISPGAVLRLAPGVSIVSYGSISAPGTPTSPIVFERLDPGRPWGVLAALNAPTESRLSFVTFSGGSDERLNGVYMSGTADFYHSDVTIESVTVTEAGADDGLNVKNARAVIHDSLFKKNSMDGIDFDFVSGEVRGSRFENNGGDGVDLSGSNELVIRDNVIAGSGDKGISIGEKSSPTIFSNHISKSAVGIAVKDLSAPKIINNVISGNEQGIASYMKKPFFGGGHGQVWNTILWNNGVEIELDDLSTITVRNSDVQGGYEGEENRDEKPTEADLSLPSASGLGTPLASAGDKDIVAAELGFEPNPAPIGLWRPL